jgi:hypothetical protein
MTPDKPATGTFLRIPYDWRLSGFWSRLKQRWWNPADPRLFTPKTFGWGYDINLARVFRRKPKTFGWGYDINLARAFRRQPKS